jgi:excisionase family DNA binding protein
MAEPIAVKKKVAATLLGVSSRTIDRRIADKTLETAQLGGLRLILRASIDRALGISSERVEAA